MPASLPAGWPPRYDFRPVTEEDLPMLDDWLSRPHIAAWWNSQDAESESVRDHIHSAFVKPMIVEVDGHAVGYIQSYDPYLEDGHPYQDQPSGTLGIDIAIADPEQVGRGHGSSIVRQFADQLLARGAPRVIVDPDPSNERAIRAYEKAGFRKLGERTCVFGQVMMMARDAAGEPA